jgi:cell wall-associated NlpC family hydrolase
MLCVAAAAVAAGTVAAVSPGGRALAASSRPAPAATPGALPALPSVPISVTDGHNEKQLLDNAISLSSLGMDGTAISAAVSATQARMDAAALLWRKTSALAAQAGRQAQAARRSASAEGQTLAGTTAAVKKALVYLYTEDGRPPTVDPVAGPVIQYAAVYAGLATSPWGVLSQRKSELSQRREELKSAARFQRAADAAASRASAALAAEQKDQNRLASELSSISSASAEAVLADHESLTAQVGSELLSTAALQFTPSKPLPAPLATTPIALAWAFAELGKSYVWGATGPNSFDCSGLTQFVWRQAGVAIPRVAADQDAWTIPVPLSQLLPGDLVFYGRTDIHHVGVYIGDGLMINAPHTGDVVRVSSIWWSDLAGFGRVHAPGTPVPAHAPPSTQSPSAPSVIPTPGPVPSQTHPPKGWKPKPGETTPIDVSTAPGPGRGTQTTGNLTTTSLPPSTGSTTSTLPVPTTAPSTTVPGTVVPSTTIAPTTPSTSTTTLAPCGGTTTTSTDAATTTTSTDAGSTTTTTLVCSSG